MPLVLCDVLRCFRDLHAARKQVFAGDLDALQAGRHKINEEFRKNKHLTNESEILEKMKTGHEAAQYLRTMVVQAALNKDMDTYEIKMTRDTAVEDNFPFLGGDLAPKDAMRRHRLNKTKPCADPDR